MKTAKTLFVILSGFLFFVTAAHTEQNQAGNESGLTSRPKTAPKTNVTPAPIMLAPQAVPGAREQRPLKNILKIEIVPPLCDSIPQAADKTHKMYYELQGALKAAGSTDLVLGLGGIQAEYSAGIKKQCCSQQKSFSVQEQQAAGCADSDTVKHCTDKLIKHCISKIWESSQSKSYIQKAEEKVNNISIKSKQLSEQLKSLQAIMP